MSAPADPSAAIRRSLALLGAASSDWRARGPSDGSTPLYWPLAVRAARAQLAHALARLERAGDDRAPAGGCRAAARMEAALEEQQQDARLGIAWWNNATTEERRRWLEAADSAVPADAWRAFRAARSAED